MRASIERVVSYLDHAKVRPAKTRLLAKIVHEFSRTQSSFVQDGSGSPGYVQLSKFFFVVLARTLLTRSLALNTPVYPIFWCLLWPLCLNFLLFMRSQSNYELSTLRSPFLNQLPPASSLSLNDGDLLPTTVVPFQPLYLFNHCTHPTIVLIQPLYPSDHRTYPTIVPVRPSYPVQPLPIKSLYSSNHCTHPTLPIQPLHSTVLPFTRNFGLVLRSIPQIGSVKLRISTKL
jgi:hypothetical protein